MQQSQCGPTEDLEVGRSILTVPTPAGNVEILVAEARDGEEVEFHLDGSTEALAYVDANAGLLTEVSVSEKEAA